ncbi:DUF6879 family protein [Micromonospora sp. NBC_01796]|uniref:DUF6879 family protein n=1 Tax=Micromonospora sp. NBC_01796 TaxID=2975987 RepID=UPI002DD9E3DA|nr:DUF6879 family protein [Micromonospora sp. NBC_01796]WSA88807.1 hypothetical protein OIE47_15020 [Micromonospora sp. NBC_01796]
MATTLDDLLRGCRRSAVHLELRDGYMRDDPAFIAWQGGHRLDLADRAAWWRPWLDTVSAMVERGVEVRRARVVSEPLSDYIRYEYDVTFPNVAAGEQVRWLPRRQATELALPGNDFWLFDGDDLVVNHFSGEGEWLGTETVTDPAVIELCASAFEAVWERATPHQDYRPA